MRKRKKKYFTGKLLNGFGLLRPPGHHAMQGEICGYCYFNNVAMCAKAAMESGRAKKERGKIVLHVGDSKNCFFFCRS